MKFAVNPTGSVRLGRILALALAFFCLVPHAAFAGSPGSIAPESVQISPTRIHSPYSVRPFSRIAVGVNVGTLGAGVEAVTPLSQKTNLRVDGQFFQYSLDLSNSGVNYNGTLNLRSARLSYDFYPFGRGFRISAGAIYNRFNAGAAALVPAGSSVTFNDTDYYSDAANPLHGNASLNFANRFSPVVSFGWGNAIPRSGHHLSFPVEIGAAFTGTPTFNMSMAGSACLSAADAAIDGPTCAPAMSNSNDFSTNLNQEIHKIRNDVSPLRVYPILNFGVAYRF